MECAENGQKLHVGGVGEDELHARIGLDVLVAGAVRRAEKPQATFVIRFLDPHWRDMDRELRKVAGKHAGGGFPD